MIENRYKTSVFSCSSLLLLLLAISLSHVLADDEREPDDFEDEADVGLTLTLPDSEIDLVVPEPDEVQTDEDEQYDIDSPEVWRVMKVVPWKSDDYPNDVGQPMPSVQALLAGETGERSSKNKTSIGRIEPGSTQNETEVLSLGQAPLQMHTHITSAAPEEVTPNPPQITEHPLAQVDYKPGEPVTLHCRAEGSPELQYWWTLDGHAVVVDSSRGITLLDDGSLQLEKPEDGVYQCFVSNDFGTSVSVKSVVKAALLDRFPTTNRIEVHRVAVGSYVKLQCQPPASSPTSTFYWGVHGNDGKLFPIDNSDRITLDYDGSLHFTNVVPTDSRSASSPPYLCVVFNPLLRSLVQGSDQKIEVLSGTPRNSAPALVWSTPTSVTAIKGALLKMKCIFSGYPTPRVTWSRLDGSSIDHALMTNNSYGQELVFNEVDFDDAGSYQCSGTNEASSVSQEFTLTVHAKPTWKLNKAPQNVDANEEDDVKFECQADGVPKPTINWSINGASVDSLSFDSRRTVGTDFLAFANVTENDIQVVQCNASNEHGYVFANAFLRVRAEPPSFVEEPQPVTKLALGQGATLVCSGEGAPKPSLNWFKDSELVVDEQDHIIIHSSGNLEIKNARFEDAGEYVCILGNKFGTDSSSGQLVVLENMKLVSVPHSQDIVAPSSIRFGCVISVDSRISSNVDVKWFKDDAPLSLDASRMTLDVVLDTQTTTSLTIDKSKSSDTGNYKCRASSDFEVVEHTVRLDVRDRPDPPFNVKLTNCNYGSTMVSFTPGSSNNAVIANFTVYVRSSNAIIDDEEATYRVASVVSGYGPYYAVVELESWRNYTFYVVAQNSIGTSVPSEVPSRVCSTPPVTPASNPTLVCAVQRSPESLVIEWEAMSKLEMRGGAFRYIVSYRRLDVIDAEEIREEVYDVTQSELVIANQDTFKKYEVYVQAANEVGASSGELNKAIVYSGQSFPSITPMDVHVVEESLNSTSVVLAWKPISQDEPGVNGFLKGYRVRYLNIAEGQTGEYQSLDVIVDAVEHKMCQLSTTQSRKKRAGDVTLDVISMEINDLSPNSEIEASVNVINSFGVGLSGNPIKFKTMEGVPSRVPVLSVPECGSSHIKLQWSSPSETNGILKGYRIEYADASEKKWEQFVTEHEHELTIYNLEFDSTYTISVCAETSVGCGEKTTVVKKTLKAGLPDRAEAVDVDLGESWVNVSWSRASPVSHPAKEYYVEYKDTSASDWQQTSSEQSVNWINVTDLQSPAEYVVRVVAVGSAEFKSYSDEVKVPLGVVERLESVETSQVVSASSGSIWLIIVLCIVGATVIVVVIICVIKKKRQPARYAVKEPATGPGKANLTRPLDDDEEKCLAEPAPRSQLAVPSTFAASSASLISGKSKGDGDNDSLEDGPDVTKFNEDGSFIGIYGPDQNTDDNNVDVEGSNLILNENNHANGNAFLSTFQKA